MNKEMCPNMKVAIRIKRNLNIYKIYHAKRYQIKVKTYLMGVF